MNEKKSFKGIIIQEKDLIGVYEFNKENEIAYLIKTLIMLITQHKKIKIIAVKNDK